MYLQVVQGSRVKYFMTTNPEEAFFLEVWDLISVPFDWNQKKTE